MDFVQADCFGNKLPTMGIDWPDLVPYSPEVAAWCKSSMKYDITRTVRVKQNMVCREGKWDSDYGVHRHQVASFRCDI